MAHPKPFSDNRLCGILGAVLQAKLVTQAKIWPDPSIGWCRTPRPRGPQDACEKLDCLRLGRSVSSERAHYWNTISATVKSSGAIYLVIRMSMAPRRARRRPGEQRHRQPGFSPRRVRRGRTASFDVRTPEIVQVFRANHSVTGGFTHAVPVRRSFQSFRSFGALRPQPTPVPP